MPAKLTVILPRRIHLLYIIDALNVGNFVRLFGRPPVVVWHDDSLGKIRSYTLVSYPLSSSSL